MSSNLLNILHNPLILFDHRPLHEVSFIIATSQEKPKLREVKLSLKFKHLVSNEARILALVCLIPCPLDQTAQCL